MAYAYGQEQPRDERGRFASGAIGPSQSRAERIALNQRLDARNRSKTYGFGPAARYMENKPAPGAGAHTTGIQNIGSKTLAEVSAIGATSAQVKTGGN
jgi:hypothetical protein